MDPQEVVTAQEIQEKISLRYPLNAQAPKAMEQPPGGTAMSMGGAWLVSSIQSASLFPRLQPGPYFGDR